MIDPVSSPMTVYEGLRQVAGGDIAGAAPLRNLDRAGSAVGLSSDQATETRPGSFGDLVGDLVRSVDDKSRVAETETRKLMLGESDNIHRSMIAMQEAGLAFNLLVEVRNKLVESYQELMRMPV